ncbi:MAG: hypothetical protein JNK94_00180 [Hyphomonadaceae bacterium]|nr:hypothetical protein [Hyphomonadaceae bacterium]
MTLDDIRNEWRARDEALQAKLAQQSAMLRDAMIERHLEKLRRQGAMSPFSMAVWIAFMACFGLFLAANWGRWEFFFPALLLQIWTVAMGALTFIEHERLRSVDLSAPVLEIQRRLAALEAERARAFQWAFLTGQVLWWIPFTIILFWGLFGVDLYRLSPFMTQFIAVNVAVGLAAIPILLWLSRVFGPRLARAKRGRALLGSVTGRDLAQARAFAERLAQFVAKA